MIFSKYYEIFFLRIFVGTESKYIYNAKTEIKKAMRKNTTAVMHCVRLFYACETNKWLKIYNAVPSKT